ncbi:hypothetical protein HPB51_010264 [Rhipicephalus microplus]|uniref:Uncharacterized protein n=1 Tax=Rhipicephalus microplus TaxID=6941 RepID=A0A9J6D4X2_RHIMP|nr:hypothetical protein HPB51_010264 [Rhipicephalus microplus]
MSFCKTSGKVDTGPPVKKSNDFRDVRRRVALEASKSDRSRFRWLAHGRHSEVFLVSSLLKRAVLKVMPVVGKFSQQRVEAITAAIECYL